MAVSETMSLARVVLAVFCFTLACLALSLDPQAARAGKPPPPPQGTAFLDNGVIKVGIDATIGGGISYLSQSGSQTNLINTYDRGREVQQSYYAGPRLDRRAEGQHSWWSPWPWNPVSGGDAYGNRPVVIASSNTATAMYLKTRPLLWDMRAEACECVFETWVTLEGRRVRVHNQLSTFRTDNRWSVALRAQELPAAYPIANLGRVVSYTGTLPFTGGPTSDIPSSATGAWSEWTSPERWGACVDASNFGVGVYSPVRTYFLGGLYGNPTGNTTSLNTCYLSPVEAVPIDKTMTFRYDYWLVVGTLNQIRQEAYALNQSPPPPASGFPSGDAQIWNFNADGDFGGWAPNDAVAPSSVSNGLLIGTASGTDPYISSFAMEKPASEDNVIVRLRNGTRSDSARLYFRTDVNAPPPEEPPVWTEENSKSIPIYPHSGLRVYRFDMSDVPGWTSNIIHLRLDPVDANGTFAVDWIRIGD